MKLVSLWVPLSIACFFALFGSALLPQVKLLAFSPFLALSYHRLSFLGSLWVASLCGLFIDLFASDLRLGIHALSLCLVTLVLYQQKRHFFEDKPLAICLFTGLISWLATLIQWILIPLCGRSFALSKGLLLTDLLIMPLCDALYAFLCFCCPLMLYSHIKKVGWKVFYETLLCRIHLRKPLPSPEE